MTSSITNWKAKRAGGRITITGVTTDGQPIKVTGVDMIECGKAGEVPTATDKDGVKYYLA